MLEKFEQWGIDEAFLDVSKQSRDWAEAKRWRRQIKQEIKEKEGITCSIGVGPSKLVAKVASDLSEARWLNNRQRRGSRKIPCSLACAEVAVGGTQNRSQT